MQSLVNYQQKMFKKVSVSPVGNSENSPAIHCRDEKIPCI